MGSYLNPGKSSFEMALNSQIFVDKSGMIDITNRLIKTMQRFVCVSRPRRFGKSMALDMLAAYYERDACSSELFQHLKISEKESYLKHLNQYDVVKINIQEFLSATHTVNDMLDMIRRYLIFDLTENFQEVRYRDENNLVQVMKDIFSKTGRSFVILIDEWDCLFREYKEDQEAQRLYLDFLRAWLKDKEYVALAYMTGILPVKKYGSHSALNMFTEYSMTNPGNLSEYFGFTEHEVELLCGEYNMSFQEAKAWYDGYELVSYSRDKQICHSMYSPKSVVEAMMRHQYGTYWNQTETYEALKIYIQMNMDGLKDAVVRMLAGECVVINTGTFTNDMTTFASKDDVLTLLVHLGYLTYDNEKHTVSIPNREVAQEYINAISTMNWQEVITSVNDSRKLLEAMWEMDEEKVAAGIDKAQEEISILQYNDENSLSCTINLAFYFAREFYTLIRELPSGKGFADICMIPRRKYADKPAAVIELKWDKSACGAIEQIKEKRYTAALSEYQGNLLLVGINYDKETKKHVCKIEKILK
ncbi:AAA family ATPase [Blautia sp.]